MVHRNGESEPIGTRAAAAQKHFYSYYRADGTRAVDVEDYLSKHVENDAAPTLARLAAGADAVQGDALALARFLAFLAVRSPRFRDLDRQLAAHLGPLLAEFDAVKHVFGGDDGIEWDDDAVARLRATVAAQPPDAYLQAPTPNSEIRTMLRRVDALEAKFASLQWAVAEADRPVFCTSDNPVSIFRPTKDPQSFHGISPDGEAEVRITLDPQHVLLGNAFRLGPDRFSATHQLVIDTNRFLAKECQYAIFHLPETTPPGDLRLAPQPPRVLAPTVTIKPNPGGGTTDTSFPPQQDLRLAEIIEATYAGDDRPAP